MEALVIDARFNGPPGSGNGGYSCGVLAAYLDGPCTVRLHVPPPLDTPLTLEREGNDAVKMYDGETLVGSAWSSTLSLAVPAAPSLDEARDASTRYLCHEDHLYPTCFVCGPKREHNDGLCLFCGPVRDWQLLASPWTPAPDMLDAEGFVRTEILWSALDCPGYFAAVGESLEATLLGQLQADIRGPVPGDETLVVYSWPLGAEGRKRYGGVAIANESGNILACSHTTWIVLK